MASSQRGAGALASVDEKDPNNDLMAQLGESEFSVLFRGTPNEVRLYVTPSFEEPGHESYYKDAYYLAKALYHSDYACYHKDADIQFPYRNDSPSIRQLEFQAAEKIFSQIVIDAQQAGKVSREIVKKSWAYRDKISHIKNELTSVREKHIRDLKSFFSLEDLPVVNTLLTALVEKMCDQYLEALIAQIDKSGKESALYENYLHTIKKAEKTLEIVIAVLAEKKLIENKIKKALGPNEKIPAKIAARIQSWYDINLKYRHAQEKLAENSPSLKSEFDRINKQFINIIEKIDHLIKEKNSLEESHTSELANLFGQVELEGIFTSTTPMEGDDYLRDLKQKKECFTETGILASEYYHAEKERLKELGIFTKTARMKLENFTTCYANFLLVKKGLFDHETRLRFLREFHEAADQCTFSHLALLPFQSEKKPQPQHKKLDIKKLIENARRANDEARGRQSVHQELKKDSTGTVASTTTPFPSREPAPSPSPPLDIQTPISFDHMEEDDAKQEEPSLLRPVVMMATSKDNKKPPSIPRQKNNKENLPSYANTHSAFAPPLTPGLSSNSVGTKIQRKRSRSC